MNRPAHSHEKQAPDACPYCGHDITRDEFLAIEARLAKEQQQKFDAASKRLSAKHLAQTSELRKQLATKDKIDKAKMKEIQEAHLKELDAKDKKTAQASAKALKKERSKWEQGHSKDKAKLEADRNSLSADRKALAKDKEAAKKAHDAELKRQRKVLNADSDKKLLAQKASGEKVTHRLQKKLEDMTRQLEQKSNDDLGDGAEVDLYNDLKEAFPDDVIVRVRKGVAGADVKQEIHVDGRRCGKIVYDSKNRADWKNKYAEQLRQDQIAEKADYAVLATRKFPAKIREMTVKDEVILVNPARATTVARLLRNALIQLSSSKLSEDGKKEKQRELFDFVTSPRFSTLFSRFEDEIGHLRKLDETEKTQQRKMRNYRAKHVGEIEKTVVGELQREIHKILGI